MKRYFGLLLVALFVAALAAPALAQEERRFKAWRASCGAGACAAETVTPGGRAALRLERASAPGAPWEISFTKIQNDVRQGSPIGVTVDDRGAMSFRPGSGYEFGGEAVLLTDPALQPILLDSLRAGNRATLSFTHNQGVQIKLNFSLAGLAASILWIDEQQGRAGETPVASQDVPPVPAEPVPVEPETAPPSSEQAAPPYPAPPAETAQGAEPATPAETAPSDAAGKTADPYPDPVDVPDQVRTRHLADGECRDYDAEHMKTARAAAKLDEHHTLYLLPCYAGAYNLIFRAWVTDARYPDQAQRQLFVGYSDALGWYGKDTLVNAEFDAATKTLTAFEKGRGLGDCGSIPTYRWHDGSWRLLEMRSWDKCDGTRQPEKWPILYQHPDYDSR